MYAIQWNDPATIAGIIAIIGVISANLIAIIKTIGSLRELHVKADSVVTDSAIAVQQNAKAEEKLEHIEHNVNGNLSKVQEELARQAAISSSLQELVTRLVQAGAGVQQVRTDPVRVEVVHTKEPKE